MAQYLNRTLRQVQQQICKQFSRESQTIQQRNYANGTSSGSTPRRAVLYVPGSDQRKLSKIPSLKVDCAVMDCEDGVAVNRKDEARHTICKALDELVFGATECVARVNSVSSGLAEEDMKVILQANRLPDTIMLPKVESVQDIKWFSETLSQVLKHRDLRGDRINLVIFVESARGLLNLRDICLWGQELSKGDTCFNLDGIVFGSDDFCADIGATRTTDAMELLYARQKVVIIAKAFGLQAIDLVHIDYKDLESLKRTSEAGAGMGFTGKQVIHPSQVPIVQAAFSPSPAKIEWASQLIEEFKLHQASGQGAFNFRGHMIDKPLLLQAENVLKLAERIKDNDT
ncbi:unnamed protein product [Owenia fusiformis]|uniref:Citramalyl-CoA lyase, mitochondrial n=1 Tax=Owenia fusiformis TaxID=6347 RepID=A0A8S4Q148_OWEFU|nr:unnamed protein product [Owenia fusiformis]